MTVVLDDFLKPYISETARHDSLARYPPPSCHPKTREKVLKMIPDSWMRISPPNSLFRGLFFVLPRSGRQKQECCYRYCYEKYAVW